MTGQEIISKLQNQEHYTISDLAYEDYIHPDLKEEIGEVVEIEQFGGEGQGDTWYSIKHFTKHDVYLKLTGYYQSYSGTDLNGWDQVYIVRPVEKTVTVYQ